MHPTVKGFYDWSINALNTHISERSGKYVTRKEYEFLRMHGEDG